MKIDYEVTVNVYGLTREEKKHVQDAFFKLGFTWGDGKGYKQLDKDCYTNKMLSGTMTQNIMWADVSMKPTHTVDQLLRLAGMKQNQNTAPFNLERALAGEPVVTRDGQEVKQLTLFEAKNKYNLVGVVDGYITRFTKDGVFSVAVDNPHALDLFMKPKTHTVNGFEVPAPEVQAPSRSEVYYIPEVRANDYYESYQWYSDDVDNRILSRNLLFLTKEDAIANAKAMLRINPYGD